MLKLTERIKTIPGKFTLQESLKSSPISQVFLCTLNNTKAVVRFDLPSASLLAIDRRNEWILLKSIQDLRIAPRTLYQDTLQGLMIWEFIEGDQFLLNSANQESSLQSLGSTLSMIHGTSTPKESKDIFSESLHLYKNLLEDSSHKSLLQKTLSLYDELTADGINYVLSHNDLNKGNILWNQRCYFLDWEYAGLNHPGFDIASLVRTYRLNKNEFHELLSGYSMDNNCFNFDQITQWVVFSELLDEVWEKSVSLLAKNTFNKAN